MTKLPGIYFSPSSAHGGSVASARINLKGNVPPNFALPQRTALCFFKGTVINFRQSPSVGIKAVYVDDRLLEVSFAQGTANEKLLEEISRIGARNVFALGLLMRGFRHDLANKMSGLLAALRWCFYGNIPSGIESSLTSAKQTFVDSSESVKRAVFNLRDRSIDESAKVFFEEIIKIRILFNNIFFLAMDILSKRGISEKDETDAKEALGSLNEFLDSLIELSDSPSRHQGVQRVDLIEAIKRSKYPLLYGPIFSTLPDFPVFIKAIPHFLSDLLDNLYANAFRAATLNNAVVAGEIKTCFRQEGGKIVFTIENDVIDLTMRKALERKKDNFLEIVLDEQDGQRKQRLFVEGETTQPKNTTDSHGAGLAICYDIVQAIGATIVASYDKPSNKFAMQISFLGG